MVKILYREASFPDATRLERWAPGASPGRRAWPGGVEILVLGGGFADERGEYGEGTWLRLPAGAGHTPRSEGGCRLYLKEGAVAHLRSAS